MEALLTHFEGFMTTKQDVLRTELKMARTAAGMSQGQLAEKAGVKVPTFRQVERSCGAFSSFEKAALALGLTIGSRASLPAGETIGEQLATY
jgi:DNA-binding XRE family transcriptional regulator